MSERTYTQAELDAMVAAAYERAAQHVPLTQMAYPNYNIVCSCGWSSTDCHKLSWSNHIRKLTPADALAQREREIAKWRDALAGVMGLIERNELVRNTIADSKTDWQMRMIEFVKILKQAQDLLDAGKDT